MSKASRRQYPVVLRFQSLFPDQINRYVLHEERKGRGSKHCDPKQRSRNRLNLLGDEDWQERFGLELDTASDENFAEEMDALKTSNRHKDYLARGREGRKDPWRKSKGGWSCPRFAGHSGSCGLSCDELAGRAHLQP